MKAYTALLLATLLLAGCATHRRAVPTAAVSQREDSAWQVRERHDTLLLRDSVSVAVETRHDTVFKTEYRERTRWRVRETHDTVRVACKDSTSVPCVIGEKPRERGFGEGMRELLIGCLAAVAVLALYGWRTERWK